MLPFKSGLPAIKNDLVQNQNYETKQKPELRLKKNKKTRDCQTE